MLTSLYYYGYYKPYIIKNSDSNNSLKNNFNRKNAKTYSNKEDNKFSFFLNKSLKDEVIKYASNISKDFNGIKDTAKYASYMISSKNSTMEEKKKNVSDCVDEFVDKYNEYLDFAEANDKHSGALDDYANSIKYRINDNIDDLNTIGVTVDKNQRLNFDKEKFSNIKASQFNDVMGNIKEMYDDIYFDTCEIMSFPMSKHMNFKGLDYYYNYKYSSIEPNTFKIIEEGMLVDIAL